MEFSRENESWSSSAWRLDDDDDGKFCLFLIFQEKRPWPNGLVILILHFAICTLNDTGEGADMTFKLMRTTQITFSYAARHRQYDQRLSCSRAFSFDSKNEHRFDWMCIFSALRCARSKWQWRAGFKFLMNNRQFCVECLSFQRIQARSCYAGDA